MSRVFPAPAAGGLLGHYALTLYRSLSRHRLFAALNVAGLAVGMSVFLVLSLDVKFETSFERWIPHAEQIYALRQTWRFPGKPSQSFDFTMGGLLDELRADYPQLVGTRVWDRGGTVRQDGRVTNERFTAVDPTFFQVFELPLASGDPRGLLSSPDQAVVTQAVARKYFGAGQAVGRRLTTSSEGRVQTYRVAAVLKDPPRNTDLRFDIVVPITPQMTDRAAEPYWNHWGSSETPTFLRFRRPSEAQALNAQFDAFIDRHGRKDMARPDTHTVLTIRAYPLLAAHLIQARDRAVVATLAAVGALVLLLAGINYVNLATARAGVRAREVAIRKVMGATTAALVAQFLGEAVAAAALAALLGLALTELALPWIDAAGGLSLRLQYFGPQSVLPFVVLTVAVVGLGAGAYPALALSRYRPAAVLASARAPGGGRAGSRLRETLVTAQFAVAIAFTVAAGVVLAQSRHLHTADLGFRRGGLILVRSFDSPDVTAAQRSALLDLWRTLPGVAGVATGDVAPGVDEVRQATSAKRPGVQGDGQLLDYVFTGPDFFSVYGVRLLAGRAPDASHASDDAAPLFRAAPPVETSTGAIGAVLNASAVRLLGLGSPLQAVGRTALIQLRSGGGFRPLTVVGVSADVRMRTPRDPVPATAYLLRTDDIEDATAGLRIEGIDPRIVLPQVAAAWRRIAPSVPFAATTSEASLQAYYRADDERSRLFTVGAVLAVGLGCVGLYGLAAFTAARRTREVGIRKTLGASTGDILRLLTGQFLRPVLLANLFAWPLAYAAMRIWLSGFDQRIALGPQYFLAATTLTLLTALLTVAGEALRVARAEPAKALRHE